MFLFQIMLMHKILLAIGMTPIQPKGYKLEKQASIVKLKQRYEETGQLIELVFNFES